MKMSERDRKLLLFIPAVLIIAVYFCFGFHKQREKLEQAESTLDRARAHAPTFRDFALVQKSLTELQHEIDTEKKTIASARVRCETAGGQCTEMLKRNGRHERLTSLLAREGLVVVEDIEAEGDKGTKLTPRLNSLSQSLTAMHTGCKPSLRRLRIQGAYAQLQRAMEALERGEALGLPIGLALKEEKGPPLKPGVREWVLLIWI